MAPLPFELVVLEVALGDVCAELGRRARELEMQAHPAVEALTKDVRSCLTPLGALVMCRCWWSCHECIHEHTATGCTTMCIAAIWQASWTPALPPLSR